jgi:peptidoglycan/LPS O-acetylase OafA/YrhL
MDSLATGALLAVLFRKQTPDELLARYGLICLLAAAGGIAVFLCAAEGELVYRVTIFTCIAVACAGLICLSLAKTPFRRLFSTVPLRFLGVYSYGIYIYHGILMQRLDVWVGVTRLTHFTGGLWSAIALHYLISFAVPIIVAFVSYHLLEKWFLKLKSRFV